MTVAIMDQLDYLDNKSIPNPINSLDEKTMNARFPTNYEPALIHPYHRSIVKLRDNGIVDVFAADHQGIRIDPNNQVINICTNKLFQHMGRIRSWITRSAKTEIELGYHMVNHGYIIIDCKGDITVNTDGNVTLSACGDVTVKSKGEINLNSKRRIQFTAPKYDFA